MLVINFNEGTIGLQNKDDSRLEDFIDYIQDRETMQDLINYYDVTKGEEENE